MVNIFIYNSNFHIKNKIFLEYFVDKYHKRVYSIEEADLIYSPDRYIDIENYPTKKFIFGPHFSVFPNNIVNRFNNTHKNAIYIQPSQPSVYTWQNEFQFKALPMRAIPFGVDTKKFIGEEKNIRQNVIVYYKSRDPNEFKFLIDFLDKKNLTYKVYSYQNKYNENDFLQYIKTCKFGIVLGRHESQGFAIEEMMSCDVPLLIWSATQRSQEYPYIPLYFQVKSNVTTVPYWSPVCGEIFHHANELENKFNVFISNVHSYTPRKFILENISFDACSKKWKSMINDIIL